MTFGTANHVPLTVVRHRGAPPGEQPVRQSNPILPQPRELIALTALLVLLITLSEGLSPAGLPMLNAFGALALAGILCPGAWRMVRAESRNIWNVLFWLRISIAVYFAFGTAAIYLMNDTTRLFVENLYFFTEPEVLKYIIITTLGIVQIYSATLDTVWRNAWWKQFVWLIAGLVLTIAGMFAALLFS